jgi:Lanthionine synthetase C-like protein
VLYAPELHEPLTDTPWDEARVRGAVEALAADASEAYRANALWPADEWDGWRAALPLKNLYVGAAGVAWALDRLRSDGLADAGIDPADAARRALDAFRAAPDFMEGEVQPQRHSALLVGETGIVLVAWLLDPDDVLEDDLLELVRQNVGNPANELMWGVPGTLLAARAVLARTGHEWWRAAVQESEDALRDARDEDGLWTQHLHGETFRSLGPAHGLVGNVAALGEPGNAADVLRERSVVEDGRANWVGTDGVGRLQWCAGAPGIVVAAAPYLDEELLLAAAELVWDAGAAVDEKGAGICHGTAGNGYALLKTFERTGDELWLDRARAFAVHALEQAQRLPGRYSLFTGGVGAALFAADCLGGRARYPVLDGF